MNSKKLIVCILVVVLSACDLNLSYNKDFITGITTQGNGLVCEDVYLSDGEQKINGTSFIYGEKFFLELNDIKGFEQIEGNSFPGMELLVESQNGDTIIFNNDLYQGDEEGTDISPLLLSAFLTTGNPMHSGNDYKLKVRIWDKKGEGMFSAKVDFDVVADDNIKILSNDFTYNEIYIFSAEREMSIIDGKIKRNENIYCLFEGLKGFSESNGNASIGIGIKVTDKHGNLLFNEKDLMKDSEIPIDAISEQVSARIAITDSSFEGKVNFEVTIWDKNGPKSITTTTELSVEE